VEEGGEVVMHHEQDREIDEDATPENIDAMFRAALRGMTAEVRRLGLKEMSGDLMCNAATFLLASIMAMLIEGNVAPEEEITKAVHKSLADAVKTFREDPLLPKGYLPDVN
jgi:hypothetical protein